MPELPEVETIVRELQQSDLYDKKIVSTHISWDKTVANLSPKEFSSQIIGQSIKKISRRGKYIVITLNKDTLLIHLRMTGKLSFTTSKTPKSSHERLQITLSDKRTLHYEDQRKFGRWTLLSDTTEKFSAIGIEPLSDEFTFHAFSSKLTKSSQFIKPFLLNQKHIAGLGNIYVDEALWLAKIHPLQKVSTLNSKQMKELFKAIPIVLSEGVANLGTSLGSTQANYYSVSGRRGGHQSHLNVFRRDKEPCPRCDTTLIKIVVAQRGTHLCPHCQKLNVQN